MAGMTASIILSILPCILAPLSAAQQTPADSVSLDIEEVIFTADRHTSSLKGSTISAVDWNLQGLDALPKIMGNPDPVRYLQFLPGVQTNSEFDAGIHIQGCDNSHNEVSVAGIPLYGVAHLFGFFSVFNPSHFTYMQLIKTTGIVTSGRIGGIVDMKLQDKVPGKVSGELNVGLMSAQGTLKIPLGKKSGLFISARQSFMNLLYKRWMKLDGVQLKYDFGDYDLTWYYTPSGNDKIWIDTYFGRDNVSLDESHFNGNTVFDWSNHLAAIHWEHRFRDRLSMTHSLFGSGFRSGLELEQGQMNLKMPSYIESYGYKGKIRHGDFLSGATLIWYDVMPQYPCLDGTHNETYVPQEKQKGLEMSLYSTYDHTFGYRWRLKAGLTGAAFMSPEKDFFWNISPSASMSYLMYRAGTVTLSYGWRHQYLFQTGLTSMGLPTEFWFLCGKHSRPQASQYASAGYEISLFKESVSVSAEVYYKKLYNQVDYKGDVFDFLNSAYSLDNVLLKGNGENYGFNIMVHKQTGHLTGWLSYSFGRALRRFNHPDYPSVYPANHERIHEFSAVAAYNLNKWDFGATFVLASGTPFTAPKSYYLVSGVIIPEYGEHNANRLRPYIRLDLSVSYSIIKNYKRECGINFSLYNATARKNDLMYRLRFKDDKFAYRPMSFFMTLVPSVSYYHRF